METPSRISSNVTSQSFYRIQVCRASNPSFRFSDDVASLHVIKEKRKRLRERLVATGGVGPYPRALSATWDIHARKTLASIPTEGETAGIGVFDARDKIVSSSTTTTTSST